MPYRGVQPAKAAQLGTVLHTQGVGGGEHAAHAVHDVHPACLCPSGQWSLRLFPFATFKHATSQVNYPLLGKLGLHGRRLAPRDAGAHDAAHSLHSPPQGLHIGHCVHSVSE